MRILRRAARDFDEKEEEEGKRQRRREEGIGGPCELLMREKLPRLLSINFSNCVAEDVPPEENRLPPPSPFHPLDFVRPSPYHSYSRPRYP